jgi:hypothetical protein
MEASQNLFTDGKMKTVQGELYDPKRATIQRQVEGEVSKEPLEGSQAAESKVKMAGGLREMLERRAAVFRICGSQFHMLSVTSNSVGDAHGQYIMEFIDFSVPIHGYA